jgi:hypothetical protein
MRIFTLLCLLLLVTAFSVAQDTDFSTGPQYLLTGSPMLARPLTTPSISLDAPLPPVPPSSIPIPESATETPSPASSQPEPEQPPDLFSIYYGAPSTSVVELSGAEGGEESLASLPASILDWGVSGMVDAQALISQGYGVPLAEAARYARAHKVPAAHVYTNADITRLHQAS